MPYTFSYTLCTSSAVTLFFSNPSFSIIFSTLSSFFPSTSRYAGIKGQKSISISTPSNTYCILLFSWYALDLIPAKFKSSFVFSKSDTSTSNSLVPSIVSFSTDLYVNVVFFPFVLNLIHFPSHLGIVLYTYLYWLNSPINSAPNSFSFKINFS